MILETLEIHVYSNQYSNIVNNNNYNIIIYYRVWVRRNNKVNKLCATDIEWISQVEHLPNIKNITKRCLAGEFKQMLLLKAHGSPLDRRSLIGNKNVKTPSAVTVPELQAISSPKLSTPIEQMAIRPQLCTDFVD